MATMPPPPPLHLNETIDILNTKSNVNIENIGMQTLFWWLIWKYSKYV